MILNSVDILYALLFHPVFNSFDEQWSTRPNHQVLLLAGHVEIRIEELIRIPPERCRILKRLYI
jgi:hypothetical protein